MKKHDEGKEKEGGGGGGEKEGRGRGRGRENAALEEGASQSGQGTGG